MNLFNVKSDNFPLNIVQVTHRSPFVIGENAMEAEKTMVCFRNIHSICNNECRVFLAMVVQLIRYCVLSNA